LAARPVNATLCTVNRQHAGAKKPPQLKLRRLNKLSLI
jgi:hypothetical protein